MSAMVAVECSTSGCSTEVTMSDVMLCSLRRLVVRVAFRLHGLEEGVDIVPIHLILFSFIADVLLLIVCWIGVEQHCGGSGRG